MSITKEQIARINELARKAKTDQGLTDQERWEQADLRRRYLDSIHENLTAQLDNTYVVDDKGNKRPLGRRE
jgi:uncharacterized protein YnzC (UPF0291/DUF896 family)